MSQKINILEALNRRARNHNADAERRSFGELYKEAVLPGLVGKVGRGALSTFGALTEKIPFAVGEFFGTPLGWMAEGAKGLAGKWVKNQGKVLKPGELPSYAQRAAGALEDIVTYPMESIPNFFNTLGIASAASQVAGKSQELGHMKNVVKPRGVLNQLGSRRD